MIIHLFVSILIRKKVIQFSLRKISLSGIRIQTQKSEIQRATNEDAEPHVKGKKILDYKL